MVVFSLAENPCFNFPENLLNDKSKFVHKLYCKISGIVPSKLLFESDKMRLALATSCDLKYSQQLSSITCKYSNI